MASSTITDKGLRVTRVGRFRTPNPDNLRRLMDGVRDRVVHFIRDYIRVRVRDMSQGEGHSSLQGYSENPVTIDYPGVKRKRKPVGGTPVYQGMFFYGGYKQYRKKAGLEAERFQFMNTGDAWKDWKVLRYGSNSTASEIGWSDQNNAMAAEESEKNRPLLFTMNEAELAAVNADVISAIDRVFFL